MLERYVFRRLADKSAFVVFEKESYKTFVIQSRFMYDFLSDSNILSSFDEFEKLNEKEQIKLLSESGIDKELT